MKYIFLFLAAALCASAQTVEYSIAFPNAIHHEAEVTVKWTNVVQPVLEARMSRSSPGRYALHEFAKNVYTVRAVDGQRRPLAIHRPDPYQWNVSGHDGTVILSYTVFGDRVDGTYLGIDQTHAHLNIPATFMWGRGFDDRPVSVKFLLPKKSGWKVATQLKKTDLPSIYTAPNLQYFMDSPVEISNHSVREWRVESGGKQSVIKLVLHGPDSGATLDAYATMVKAIVSEHRALWGSLPAFDFGDYHFLCDYHPQAKGDGMEHRNSTVVASSLTLKKDAVRLLKTVSHEFFHAWNVERIRPRDLEPFNFEQANMTNALWFAEGFTTYYGSLLVKRSGIISLADYAKDLAGTLNIVLNAPGTAVFSAAEMSEYAPFADAATSVDPTNTANTYLSYYPYGAAIALVLDLTIRMRFPGRSLDDVMRRAKKEYGETEKPYALGDLTKMLGDVLNDSAFAAQFFRKYVYGKQLGDFGSLLAAAGLELRREKKGKASLGPLSLTFSTNKGTIASGTKSGSPAYRAGLDRGDVLLAVNGRSFSSTAELDSILSDFSPGDTVTIRAVQRDGEHLLSVLLEEDPEWEIVPFEKAGKIVTPEIITLRENWLGKQSEETFPSLQKHCPECRRISAMHESFCPEDGTALSITPSEK